MDDTTVALFRSVGGRVVSRGVGGPDDIVVNFGLVPPTKAVKRLFKTTPTLHAKYPAMRGRWDNLSTVNHWNAVRQVLGEKHVDLIQYQPRGTCGGRAGSFASDAVQCVMIASGKRAKFKRASHAFLYWQARKKYGMANGNPNNENLDGVPGGSIPEILVSVGQDTREETGDLNAYGAGSDDLACLWGAGKIDAALARRLEEAATDNVVTDWAPVRSAQELADGIAAGGIGIGSDSQGYTMRRDANGFCRPSGTWYHYHVRMSVGVWNGQRGFGYNQSWGRGTPSGPLLPGHPDNCFGVDWATQDRVCRNGQWAVIFGFQPFELEQGGGEIPWIFK